MAETTLTERLDDADVADAQGLVFAGFGRSLPLATYLIVEAPRVRAAARRWLAELVGQIVRGRDAAGDIALQLALTPRGLAAFGVPAPTLAQFAQEATLGMAARSRTLGDEGANDPAHWAFGRVGDRIDALVIVMARTAAARAAAVAHQRDRLAYHAGHVLAEEESAEWQPKEPFGFADGLSQPAIRGVPPRNGNTRAPDDEIAPGEILLGHKNEYGFEPRSPRWDGFDLGRNGTYLVLRKLRQDVGAFWRFFAERAGELAGQAPVPRDRALATHWLAARAMGRWRNGTSTVEYPDAPGPDGTAQLNDFEYLQRDPHGLRCPIASHVRRANPRDARGGPPDDARMVVRRHRILRRGRAYGTPVEPEDVLAGRDPPGTRGLLFVSLQSSIARGFEFVQQTWLANPGFHGLFDEADPITGPGGGPYTIPASPVRVRLCNLPRFVTVRGGAYFFLPSIRALQRLAT